GGFLPDTPTGLGKGASGRAGHGSDAQVLDPDDVEPASDVGGGLLDPVLVPVGLARLEFGDRGLDARPSARAFHRTGQPALQQAQPGRLGGTQAGTMQRVAGGQGRTNGHAAGDADDLAGAGARDGFGDCGEGDVPAPRPVASDPVGFGGWDGAGPAKAHPSGRWDPDLA